MNDFQFLLFVFLGAFEGKLLGILNAPTRFTFPSNNVLLRKIEAVLLPQTVMTDTKIKKKFIL